MTFAGGTGVATCVTASLAAVGVDRPTATNIGNDVKGTMDLFSFSVCFWDGIGRPTPGPLISAEARVAAGLKVPPASQLREVANRSVRAYAESLKASMQNKLKLAGGISGLDQELPLTTVVAYDVRTGNMVAAFNGPIPSEVTKPMADLAAQGGGLGVKTACGNTMGRCAEFRAANQLVKMGSNVDDIRFSDAIRPWKGTVKEPCPNCKAMFGGQLSGE